MCIRDSFKGGVSLEAMKNVKAVVMDKTGTITKGNFVLQQIDSLEGVDSQKVLEVAAICEQNSTHPIGVSILAAAKEKGIALEKPQQVTEQAGQGIAAQASQGLALCGNRKLLENHGVQDVYKRQVSCEDKRQKKSPGGKQAGADFPFGRPDRSFSVSAQKMKGDGEGRCSGFAS